MLKVSVSTISESKIFPPEKLAGKSSKRAAAVMVTSSETWWEYGSRVAVAVGISEDEEKSSRTDNDRIFWVMRPPWVKKVRIEKSMKKVLSFSKNPGAFLSELSSARFLEPNPKISPRDEDRFELSDARRA